MFFFFPNYENDCEKKGNKKWWNRICFVYVWIPTSQGECHENFVHSVVCLQKTQ